MDSTTPEDLNSVKVFVCPNGYMPSTIARMEKEDPSIKRVYDIKQADVGYVDSEVEHWLDYGYDYDKYYQPFEAQPKDMIGLYSPFYTKAGSKKRAAIMFKFANLMFPGTYNIHPLSFNYPEAKGELVEYMQANPESFFIAKPDDGVCGSDIKIIHSVQDLEELLPNTQYIIQYYVNNPILLGHAQRKIDFRVSFTQIFRNNQNLVYFSTQHQGRVAPLPYEPLTSANKDNISTHITCYEQLFENDYPLYFPTLDGSTWSDKYNFQQWKNICKYYKEETAIEDFEEKCNKVFKDFALQTNSILTPFFNFFFEIGSREAYEKKNINFFNLWGMDILMDDNMKPYWLENNLTPSNGDINESQNTGTPTNPAFIQFGRDCISLWTDCAKHKEDYEYRKMNGVWEQISGPVSEDPYTEQSKVLAKLFNLYIYLTTGKPTLPKIDVEKTIEGHRFPVEITNEQVNVLAKMNKRVTEEELRDAYSYFQLQEKKDIYLLSMILTKLYTREEILQLFEIIDNLADREE